MEKEYENILSGKLKLKSNLDPSRGLKNKKKEKSSNKKKHKKKKRKKERSVEGGIDYQSHEKRDQGEESKGKGAAKSQEKKINIRRKRSLSSSISEADGQTASERRFQEMQRKREKDLISKMVSKTHRERINDFNNKLASLSEHHDVPKVGNAGMG